MPRSTCGWWNYFNVHGVTVDPATRQVFVNDRGNLRIQVFDENGKFVCMWKVGPEPANLHFVHISELTARLHGCSLFALPDVIAGSGPPAGARRTASSSAKAIYGTELLELLLGRSGDVGYFRRAGADFIR